MIPHHLRMRIGTATIAARRHNWRAHPAAGVPLTEGREGAIRDTLGARSDLRTASNFDVVARHRASRCTQVDPPEEVQRWHWIHSLQQKPSVAGKAITAGLLTRRNVRELSTFMTHTGKA
jgi:hypothetical protein